MPNSPFLNQRFNALQQAAYQLSSCTDQLFLQIEQQQTLASIIDRIRSSLDLNIIFKTTVTEIRQLLSADRVVVFRFQPDNHRDAGEFVAEDVGAEFSSVLASQASSDCFDSQLAAFRSQAHLTPGQVQAIADIYEAGLSDCHLQVFEQLQIRANLTVPVLKGDKLWCLLCIHQCSHPRRWQLSEIEFVQKIADHFTIALQQAEYLDQLQDKATLIAQARAQEKALIRQKALVKITNRIRQSLDWEVICETATEEVRQLLEADRVTIYRFNADWSGNFLFESVAAGWKLLVGASPSIEDTHLMETQGGRYAHNETFAVTDIYKAGHSDCHVALLEEFQARAYAIAPIFKGDRLWGLLTAFQNAAPRRWKADEVELLTQIGEQLGITLQQAYEQEQKLNRQKALVKITNRIRQSFDFAAICQTATEEVRQLLKADRVTIYRFNPDWSGDVLFESVAAEWRPLVGASPSVEDTYLMETQGGRYAHNETFAVTDIYKAGHSDCHVALLEEFQARAYAIAPIFKGDRLWGLLTAFQNAAPRRWKADEVELLTQIGEQLGIALQQAESVRKIQTQSLELKQLLEELKQSQAQLIQNEKMASLGQMVAGVAHEINNPVNFIYANLSHVNGYVTELLSLARLHQQSLTAATERADVQAQVEKIDVDFILEDLPKTLSSMRVGAERIRNIVLSLHNFSHLNEAEVKTVDIHKGIDSTLLVLSHRLRVCQDKACTTSFQVEIVKNYGDIPPINCYPAQLNQVFMNLLSNSLDALETAVTAGKLRPIHSDSPQQPKIWISTRLNQQDQVEVRICDNGIGINEKDAGKIFDHFFTTKPVGKGKGLGLAISKQIVVEQHGGTLSLNTASGQYAEFILCLPTELEQR